MPTYDAQITVSGVLALSGDAFGGGGGHGMGLFRVGEARPVQSRLITPKTLNTYLIIRLVQVATTVSARQQPGRLTTEARHGCFGEHATPGSF